MKGHKMTSSVSKTFILAVGIILGAMLFAGCEEEEKISDIKLDTLPDAKRSRLIAVENVQLKQQIEKLKEMHAVEIEGIKELNDKEKQRQKKLLDECVQEKSGVEEVSKKGVESYMQDFLGPVADENIKLQEDIKTLKAQIEQLKAELEELKRPKILPL